MEGGSNAEEQPLQLGEFERRNGSKFLPEKTQENGRFNEKIPDFLIWWNFFIIAQAIDTASSFLMSLRTKHKFTEEDFMFCVDDEGRGVVCFKDEPKEEIISSIRKEFSEVQYTTTNTELLEKIEKEKEEKQTYKFYKKQQEFWYGELSKALKDGKNCLKVLFDETVMFLKMETPRNTPRWNEITISEDKVFSHEGKQMSPDEVDKIHNIIQVGIHPVVFNMIRIIQQNEKKNRKNPIGIIPTIVASTRKQIKEHFSSEEDGSILFFNRKSPEIKINTSTMSNMGFRIDKTEILPEQINSKELKKILPPVEYEMYDTRRNSRSSPEVRRTPTPISDRHFIINVMELYNKSK
jgi:hypothetical protein